MSFDEKREYELNPDLFGGTLLPIYPPGIILMNGIVRVHRFRGMIILMSTRGIHKCQDPACRTIPSILYLQEVKRRP